MCGHTAEEVEAAAKQRPSMDLQAKAARKGAGAHKNGGGLDDALRRRHVPEDEHRIATAPRRGALLQVLRRPLPKREDAQVFG